MKNAICLCGVFLCLLMTASCYHPSAPGSSEPATESILIPSSSEVDSSTPETPSTMVTTEATTSKPLILTGRKNKAYFKAYAKFLLHSDTNIEEDPGFPIFGYYLIDLNFDGIPELGVYRDSGGTLWGYFTFYSFDGKKVVPVLDDTGKQARSSTHTQILADKKNRKVYLFKETRLLMGNDDGLYGYLYEIKNRNGTPLVHYILNLEVSAGCGLKTQIEDQHEEDAYLTNSKLEDCLLTQRWSDGKWKEISSAQYLKKKRQIIPKKNDLVDLRDTKARVVCDSIMELSDKTGRSHDKRLTSEEIDLLITKWLDQTK